MNIFTYSNEKDTLQL